MARPTKVNEIRVAREMRARGESLDNIAAYFDRSLKWVSVHTANHAPHRERSTRAKDAMTLRDKGWSWDAVARKVGYKNINTACVSVCIERRRQKVI